MKLAKTDQTHQSLLLYDGECPFCCQSAARWERKAGEGLRVMPAQSGAGADYGFNADQKIRSVTLVEADGKIFEGAAAIFRLMKSSRCGAHFWNLYEKVKPFRLVADWCYRFVARYRLLISKLL